MWGQQPSKQMKNEKLKEHIACTKNEIKKARRHIKHTANKGSHWKQKRLAHTGSNPKNRKTNKMQNQRRQQKIEKDGMQS